MSPARAVMSDIAPNPTSLPTLVPKPSGAASAGDFKLETLVRATAGQLIVVKVTGSNLTGYSSGVYDTLEANVKGAWRTVSDLPGYRRRSAVTRMFAKHSCLRIC